MKCTRKLIRVEPSQLTELHPERKWLRRPCRKALPVARAHPHPDPDMERGRVVTYPETSRKSWSRFKFRSPYLSNGVKKCFLIESRGLKDSFLFTEKSKTGLRWGFSLAPREQPLCTIPTVEKIYTEKKRQTTCPLQIALTRDSKWSHPSPASRGIHGYAF